MFQVLMAFVVQGRAWREHPVGSCPHWALKCEAEVTGIRALTSDCIRLLCVCAEEPGSEVPSGLQWAEHCDEKFLIWASQSPGEQLWTQQIQAHHQERVKALEMWP